MAAPCFAVRKSESRGSDQAYSTKLHGDIQTVLPPQPSRMCHRGLFFKALSYLLPKRGGRNGIAGTRSPPSLAIASASVHTFPDRMRRLWSPRQRRRISVSTPCASLTSTKAYFRTCSEPDMGFRGDLGQSPCVVSSTWAVPPPASNQSSNGPGPYWGGDEVEGKVTHTGESQFLLGMTAGLLEIL